MIVQMKQPIFGLGIARDCINIIHANRRPRRGQIERI